MDRTIKGCAVFMLKRMFCLLLCFCMLMMGLNVSAASAAVTVSSECDITDIDVPLETETVNAAIGQTLDINAKSAFLMEPYSGEILYEDNADEVLPPASITKIMSLLLVMEAIDRGDLSLETIITASEHACSMGGSQIWLEPGEAMSVDDLLKAAVIASANDATVALGETIAGSEEGFVAQMNARAEELGMTNTKFINCTGLDAEGHVTTAHDVGLMAAALIKHPLIKEYSTVWMDTLRDGKSELVNTNKLVRFYKGTTGLKTGTTSGAGYCLAATAERDGMELVAVIMGGNTSDDRFNGAKKLLDFGFANYAFTEITPELPIDFTADISNGVQKTVKAKAEDKLGFLLPKTDKSEFTQSIALKEDLTAPIKKGDNIGMIEVYKGEEQIGTIDIIASENVDKMTFMTAFMWLVRGLFSV